MVRETRTALIAHVGGAPSATQRALIERAVQLTLQVGLMDRKAGEAGGTMAERDSRQYLAWSNSLCRTLKLLGTAKAPERAPHLRDYLADRAAQAAV